MLDLPTAEQPLDLYAVHAKREELLERAEQPRFSAWWTRFVDSCRSFEAAAGTAAGELAGHAERLAFAAALTQDGALGDQVAACLRGVLADDQPWMSPEHHHHYPELNADLLVAERCKRLAAAVSWARPWLDEPLHRAVIDLLCQRGGAVIAADAERGAWWSNGYNSNWTAVLNSGLGLAALAVAESYPAEAEAWLERAAGVMRAMLNLAVDEGAGVEGLSYWTYCFRSILDLAEALRCLGDGSLLAHRFWARAVEFPLYLALPDLSGWNSFGDCRYPGLGGSHLFYAIASRAGDRRAQWLANRIGGGPSHLDLLFCDPELQEEPQDSLPPSRLFKSVHLAVLRSDWTPDATQFVLKGGSNAWSHCHLDLNSFVLTAAGERLAVDPGPWHYTPHYWSSVEPPCSTAWHNTLTVDGGDQRQPPRYRLSYDLEEGGDAWCRLDSFADEGDRATVEGDATSAYADTLERFVRRVTWLKPDLFVIDDLVRVREVRAQRHLQWLLHSALPMEEVAGGLVVRGERVDLWVTPLRPDGWAAKTLPDRLAPAGEKAPPVHAWALRPRWHHLWNVSPRRSPHPHWEERGQPPLYGPDYRFLVLLEVCPAGTEPGWRGEVGPAGLDLQHRHGRHERVELVA